MSDNLAEILTSKNPVELVWITPGAEKIISFCARVSSPQNQLNESIEKLIAYCIKNAHWSIFEQANMCVQITTGRDISAQILRHKSFSFQEYSLRYSKGANYQKRDARRQDQKNRQNSIDDLSDLDKKWFLNAQEEVWEKSYNLYEKAVEKGIAKECARSLLPLNTETRLYMNGTIRSWIHYIDLRSGNGTQLEHQRIANAAKEIFCENLPIIASAMGWAPVKANSKS